MPTVKYTVSDNISNLPNKEVEDSLNESGLEPDLLADRITSSNTTITKAIRDGLIDVVVLTLTKNTLEYSDDLLLHLFAYPPSTVADYNDTYTQFQELKDASSDVNQDARVLKINKLLHALDKALLAEAVVIDMEPLFDE